MKKWGTFEVQYTDGTLEKDPFPAQDSRRHSADIILIHYWTGGGEATWLKTITCVSRCGHGYVINTSLR